jgi:hypothetical protein
MTTVELEQKIALQKWKLEQAEKTNIGKAEIFKLYKELKALQFEYVLTEIKEKYPILCPA